MPVRGGIEMSGKYLSLTSFRRDGTPVATPVWFVQDGDRLLVETDAASYKVRRIRRTPAVTVAACTATGRVRGPSVAARAAVLPQQAVAPAQQLMARKYRVDLMFIKPIRAVQRALGAPAPRPVILEIRST